MSADDKAKQDSTESISPKGQQINVLQDLTNLPSFYANRVESRMSQHEVCLRLMEALDATNQEATFRHLANVWMSIAQAKAFSVMLSRQVKKYEEKFGPIVLAKIEGEEEKQQQAQ